MTIKQLAADLAELAKTDGDAQIFMSQDAEGNGFHTVEEIAPYSEKKDRWVIWPNHAHLEDI